MNILLVYPHYPATFWSFRYAMKFIGRKASFPPLGLMTVAAMLPDSWEKRLVDMNVRPLADADLQWADYVFISAMSIQRASADEVIERCLPLGVKIVAGGPLFTSCYEDFIEVDHLVLGEAEITLPRFLEDLQGGTPRRIYHAEGWAQLEQTPMPLWNLVRMRDYAAMNVQYGRGCPFDCEFCDITSLFGRRPRSKPLSLLLAELESLYTGGWRGAIFFVDDNFIGDKPKLKQEILPALIDWMKTKNYPFYFYTEASIDLADDAELLNLMVDAGFEEVFIGIETPHDGGLFESGKSQNRNRDLLLSVKRIQQAGLQVHGGFIVGFDSDPISIFDQQIRFIQESGIVTAMVGVLSVLRGTKLHQRMEQEGRLLKSSSGDNTAIDLNFVPRMKAESLIAGYQDILTTIYAPKQFYQRVTRLFREYQPRPQTGFHLQQGHLGALFKSMLFLGVLGKERFHYWKLFFWSLFRKPRLFPLAITYAVYGFHFRKVAEQISGGNLFADNQGGDTSKVGS
ncbi:B12-binding domain-containing radical SAM protein [Pelovirga terrestris]|uniref:B12-binding domain-containing radical SAM protein n=1 Tax=Pelovirga terrestris TaxID=2771352 RepID=A0A8J6R5S7_9BACT|nr:B12-binding domain-containing radical SAM protein [Pelovirga terrestris]MBD1400599.1 B12-binding domain-containing radical SAM protein [Pelovirga terrestris]